MNASSASKFLTARGVAGHGSLVAVIAIVDIDIDIAALWMHLPRVIDGLSVQPCGKASWPFECSGLWLDAPCRAVGLQSRGNSIPFHPIKPAVSIPACSSLSTATWSRTSEWTLERTLEAPVVLQSLTRRT